MKRKKNSYTGGKAKKQSPVKPPYEDKDFPAGATAQHAAQFVVDLYEAGIIKRAPTEQMAIIAMNFSALCQESINDYMHRRLRDLMAKGIKGGVKTTHISSNGLAILAASLTKAKLISIEECAGDLRKLADKALEFCTACGLAATQRNLYCAKDSEIKNAWGQRLHPFRSKNRVPLEFVLDWAGLKNSTLINEFKADGVDKDWESLSLCEKNEEMFRYLTREPVELQWTDLPPETGLAHEWSRKETVGDAEQINVMIATGVTCEMVPRVVEILKIAKKKKESDQKRRAAQAVQEKKKKM